jgi:hypothetical protein
MAKRTSAEKNKALRMYLGLGSVRTLAEVSRQTGIGLRTLQTWSSLQDWKTKARTFDGKHVSVIAPPASESCKAAVARLETACRNGYFATPEGQAKGQALLHYLEQIRANETGTRVGNREPQRGR